MRRGMLHSEGGKEMPSDGMTRFRCICGKRLKVLSGSVGMTRCPRCGASLRLRSPAVVELEHDEPVSAIAMPGTVIAAGGLVSAIVGGYFMVVRPDQIGRLFLLVGMVAAAVATARYWITVALEENTRLQENGYGCKRTPK